MNAVERRATGSRAANVIETIAAAMGAAAVHALRVVLFSLLAVLAPIVRCVLSLGALVCFLMCAFYALASPPGVHFPYGLALAVGLGSAVLLTVYEIVLRALEP